MATKEQREKLVAEILVEEGHAKEISGHIPFPYLIHKTLPRTNTTTFPICYDQPLSPDNGEGACQLEVLAEKYISSMSKLEGGAWEAHSWFLTETFCIGYTRHEAAINCVNACLDRMIEQNV